VLSVLTRLPAPSRLTPAAALRLIITNFPNSRYLPVGAAEALLQDLAELRVAGGAVYDALVGAAARHHQLPLLSSDRRATATYDAIGVDVDLV
jgi:hypothetical protein